MLEYQQYEKRMERKTDEKIGIIGAMELEVETLKSKMNVVKTTKKQIWNFSREH